jgi:hypothetical protein|tara:strand:- start:511 stop:675 length:165 start_codon:yes stop_codon:yes gene_type:complete
MNRPIFRDTRDLTEEQKLFFKIELIYSHIHGEPHIMELSERLMRLSIMSLDDKK